MSLGPIPSWAWIPIGLAALLLAAWVYSRVQIHRSRTRLNPLGTFLDVDGVRVHLLRRGEGPLVLCLHGLAGFLEDFVEPGLVDALAADFEVAVLDRPGYGYSQRPDPGISDVREQADWLARLIDELGHENAIVVGHSLGGAVAMALAVRHPDRVRGLVLLGPYVYPHTEPDDWIHKLPRLPWLRTMGGHTLVIPIARLLEPWLVSASFDPQPIPDGYHRLWLDHVLDPDHFDTTIEEARSIDPALGALRTGYPDVRVPTVILTGDQDASVDPDANARRLAGELALAELTVFDGYGHMVPWTHPDAVVDAVRWVHDRGQAEDADAAQERSEA